MAKFWTYLLCLKNFEKSEFLNWHLKERFRQLSSVLHFISLKMHFLACIYFLYEACFRYRVYLDLISSFRKFEIKFFECFSISIENLAISIRDNLEIFSSRRVHSSLTSPRGWQLNFCFNILNKCLKSTGRPRLKYKWCTLFILLISIGLSFQSFLINNSF